VYVFVCVWNIVVLIYPMHQLDRGQKVAGRVRMRIAPRDVAHRDPSSAVWTSNMPLRKVRS
jgi:hypothetical protein